MHFLHQQPNCAPFGRAKQDSSEPNKSGSNSNQSSAQETAVVFHCCWSWALLTHLPHLQPQEGALEERWQQTLRQSQGSGCRKETGLSHLPLRPHRTKIVWDQEMSPVTYKTCISEQVCLCLFPFSFFFFHAIRTRGEMDEGPRLLLWELVMCCLSFTHGTGS